MLETKNLLKPGSEIPEISRRSVLMGLGLLAAEAAFRNRRQLVQRAGEQIDTLLSPENIIPRPLPVLEPREHDNPVVIPKLLGEPVTLETAYTRQGETVALQLASEVPLQAEHTEAFVPQGEYLAAGAAIITTAEGLELGEQVYATLFRRNDHVLAVGYEGGMYAYQPQLGEGEWVRIIAENDAALPSPLHTSAPWKELETAAPDTLLIEDVVQGMETFRDIGYKPWAAVLPSTQMPGMRTREIDPASFAQNIEEVNQGGDKAHFVTRNGDLIDIAHLQAKAGETLSLFSHLYYQHLAEETSPTASVMYAQGYEAEFEFSVEPESLRPDTILDTTFQLMHEVGVRMEGVAQRYMLEKIGSKHTHLGGVNPEDMFSNSAGIVSMLSLIREQKIGQELEASLRAIHRHHPDASAEQIQPAIERVIWMTKRSLVKQAVRQVAHDYGVRPQEVPTTVELPPGLYPLIPTKVNAKDTTPTHIDVRGTGIRTNNPRVRYKVTDAPAMETAAMQTLGKMRL